MKLLLKLSLAALLVSSTFGLTLQEFVRDPQVQTLAPHLLQDIDTKGIESFSLPSQDPTLIPDLQLPVLNDIVQFVSLNIFHASDADWSRLEAAKLQAIEKHGADALSAASNLNDIDTRRAALIVNTIYDTVIGLPAPSKETYAAKVEAENQEKKADAESNAEEEKKKKAAEEKKEAEAKEAEEAEEAEKKGSSSSTLWQYLGFGLIKSSETVKKAKGIVTPRAVCETTDTAYLKGVEDVVYYSSLTHGLAGGALTSAPAESPVQSLDLKTIVGAVGKLAIEVHMAQSVARLSGLNPSDPQVRALTYLALTADSPTAPSAQNARDIHNLIDRGLASEIPESVVQSYISQSALILVTRGAGEAGESPSIFRSIPVVSNLFAFSSDVLSANNMGDVLKYVFCPESSQATEPAKVEVIVEDIKKEAENIADKASEGAQKVLKMPEDAAKKVTENAEAAQDKAAAAAEDARKKMTEVKDEASAKAADAAANVQDKVAEGTKKVNDAGEKIAQEAKDKADAAKKAAENVEKKVEQTAEDAKKKAEGVAENVEKKAEDMKEKVVDEAKSAADKAAGKAEEIKEEL
ncbi:hypothetical protein BGZ95_002773 [Linnemannia exigua]|uniref:Uncharacterized protein n=1 Tax=Linnemannia exigua TaxID=604196 RepID=A0AAD4DIE6_9FUNG|nr:hypothetical protein BGZ95_002773 [Linnemannia exigua]